MRHIVVYVCMWCEWCWKRHVVDSFTWQNVSAPKGLLQFQKKVQNKSQIILGPKCFAKWSCLPCVLRSRTNKYLYIDVVMNLYSNDVGKVPKHFAFHIYVTAVSRLCIWLIWPHCVYSSICAGRTEQVVVPSRNYYYYYYTWIYSTYVHCMYTVLHTWLSSKLPIAASQYYMTTVHYTKS